jgi:tetratricopeptide (TPR) repeat protein
MEGFVLDNHFNTPYLSICNGDHFLPDIKPMKAIILSAFSLLFVSLSAWAQGDAVALLQNGSKYYASKNYKEAFQNFNQAIETDPSFAQAYYMRGTAKKGFDDLHGAMKDFNKAIELNANMADAYHMRGNLKYELQDYYGAIQDFTRAIAINPNHQEAYYSRGMAKQQIEAYEDAINDCSKLIELNPKNIDAYFLRGVLRLEHGQTEAGCLDLSKAGEMGDIKAYEVIRDKCNQKCFVREAN